MKVFSVINYKGGDGKTTTAIQLAHILAGLQKKRGLFVDLDGQANATKHLYGSVPGKGIADLLEDPELDPMQVLVGLDKYWGELVLLPGTRDLNLTDRNTADRLQRELMLKDILVRFARHVDFVVIDTPPAMDIRVVNALSASHYYLIPTKAASYSLDGIRAITKLAEVVRAKINPELELLGVLCCQYHKANALAIRALIADIKAELPGKYLGEIHHSAKFEEAAMHKVSIQTLEESNRAAAAYRDVAQKIMELV